MHKHFLWASMAIACVLPLSACTEVRSCERGTPGCVDGPPDSDGKCQFELKLSADGKKCVEPSGGSNGNASSGNNDGDGGQDDGGNSGNAACGPCDDGDLCTTDTMSCVDFCEVPEILPGSVKPPPWIKCGGEMVDGMAYDPTFDETCRADCELFCRAQADYCGKPCAPGYCEDPSILMACHDACDGETDPKSCLRARCNDTRAAGCPNTPGFCLDGSTPDCKGVTCLNTCSFPFDGACDDGDTFSGQYIECEWGTDCADCGPRRGEDETRSLPQGGLCNFNAACDGYSKVYDRNDAFCVTVEPGSAIFRCMLDCSSDDEKCPEGYECTMLTKDGSPLKDDEGTIGRFCKPKIMCN